MPTEPFSPAHASGRHGRIAALVARARILRVLRAELDDRGFVEVQTPLLVPGTCPDRAIESFEVPGAGYLVSSTEYQLKRLFADGLGAAYTLGAAFRAGDLGEVHNPEFTMLEWGRAGATMAEVEGEAEAMVRRAADTAGQAVPAAWGRVTVRVLLGGAFDRAIASWDDLRAIPGPFAGSEDAAAAGAHLSWLIDTALAGLPPEVPTWVVGWPAQMTTSAGLDPDDPSVTLRSELYWRGLEISDGFPFSDDAAWQRARATEENEARRTAGRSPVTLDERFLQSVAHLPHGAGMALGVDRLCMALLGAPRLKDVMTFDWGDR